MSGPDYVLEMIEGMTRAEISSYALRLAARVAKLEGENAKLRKCVEAADAMRSRVTTLSTYDDKERVMLGRGYDAARAEVDTPPAQGDDAERGGGA